MVQPANAASSLTEFSTAEWLGIGVSFLIWFGFAAFFVWFFWKVIRAQLRMPDELAGIRKALERIADKLENN